MSYQFFSIGIYMFLMIGVGYYAYKKSTANLSEYMLGGRSLGPVVTALSVGASDMSGWLLMGLPGAMYASGLSAMWISIGLTLGAYFNYLLVAPRLRIYTELADNAITVPNFFQNRFGKYGSSLRLISASIIFIFFTLYTSSGMVAGGRLFESAFGLSYHWGLFLTAGVVVFYTFFGGFLAVSLTDLIQGSLIVIALVIVPIIALSDLGGMHSSLQLIKDVNVDLLSFLGKNNSLAVVSFIAWGLGYFGQPHIIVRFMAIRSVKQMASARRIGISWMLFSVLGAMTVGLVGIAYVAKNKLLLDDPEAIFIRFSQWLFHPFIGGFLLSAILAAIMSSISSQLLVTSSAITEDFYKSFFHRKASDKQLVFVGRMAVLLVALVAIFLSLDPNDNVLNLVGRAWAGFGAAFGPVVLFSLHWRKTSGLGALCGMIAGALTVLVWINSPLKNSVYEILPGFLVASVVIFIVSLLNKKPDKKISHTFDQMLSVWHHSKK